MQSPATLLCFFIVETLNGNLILKPENKIKFNDYIQLEIYATDEIDAKNQFKQYKKEIKELLK